MKDNNKHLLKLEFEVSGDKEYEIETIRDSVVYVNKVEDQLLGLYY